MTDDELAELEALAPADGIWAAPPGWKDWRLAVANGETSMGFLEWVEHRGSEGL